MNFSPRNTDAMKVVVPAILGIVMFIIATYGFILPSFEQSLLDRKKESIRELIKTADSILHYYEAQVRSGVLTTPTAQEKALSLIRSLRYGPEAKDYFWINDMQPAMVMHPYRPDLEGRDLSNFTDPAGKQLFVSFVDLVKKNSAGFEPYLWQWQDQPDKIAAKLSYVSGFQPWGWIIGTGVYLDDIEHEFTGLTRKATISSLSAMLVVAILSLYIIRAGLTTAGKKRLAENEVARYQNHLEDLVAARTCELQTANTLLNREIHRHHETLAALEVSEERHRDLFENASDLIQSIDTDKRIVAVNDAWRLVLGYSREETDGLVLDDIIHPDNRRQAQEIFAKILAGIPVDHYQIVFRKKNGQKVTVEGKANCKFIDGKPVATREIYRDVSVRNKLNDELLKIQKLESLGILAGGIAHDFNNLLTAILGNITLINRQLLDHNQKYRLSAAEKACLRAKDLTMQLLTFAKGGAPVKKNGRIEEILIDAVNFTLRGANTSHAIQLAPDLRQLEMDAGQISQVIHNLLINACQAMPGGGIISITGRNRNLAKNELPLLPPGEYVEIAIADQGTGIAPEHQDKIFDPFFTTKTDGSGLGLAVAYSVIRNHGGHITASSKPGLGAIFTCILPASLEQKPVADQPVPAGETKGTGRILLMDDEILIRDVAGALLRHLGYEVELACNGSEALALVEKSLATGKSYDGLIMDLTVPGAMGGREAMAKINEIAPGIKALVSSGYSNDPVMANPQRYGFSGVIAKPYQLEELNDALKKLSQAS